MRQLPGLRYILQGRFYSTVVDEGANLYSKRVTFKGGKGQLITVDAVYQDSIPTVPTRATVVALHGSPGSHNDFKYMVPLLREKGIRVVSLNYPGHGFTQNDDRLTWENPERNSFAQSVIDSLELCSEGRLIFLGHSRGGENSLQLGIHNSKATIGVVILNSPGLRMHRGIKPFWRLALMMKLASMPSLRPVIYPLLNFLYNSVLGLRVPSGEVAACSMLPLKTFAFERQLPDIERLCNDKTMRLLYAYSGNDFLIEKENADEFAAAFAGRRHLECLSKGNAADDERIRAEMASLFAGGQKIVTAYFAKEDHFLQKHRAGCISDAIHAIASHHEGK